MSKHRLSAAVSVVLVASSLALFGFHLFGALYLSAALVLGANERQAFWNITVPLIRTGIVTGAVFAFAISMDDVAVSMFLTDPTTYTLPVALVANMRASFDLTIAAAAVLLTGITTILILILERMVGLDRILGQGLFRS